MSSDPGFNRFVHNDRNRIPTASNLKPYNVAEPQRFTGYYDSMAAHTEIVIARAAAHTASN
jgi:hypothetical protein